MEPDYYLETYEFEYLRWLETILKDGFYKEDRTGVGTISLSGIQIAYDGLILKSNPLTSRGRVEDEYYAPILTTKKIFVRGVVEELFWVLRGETNEKILADKGVNFWKEWAAEDGSLGPIYGKQLRDYNGIDQLNQVLQSLKTTPESRRHLITLWNPNDLPEMALPPCHGVIQQFVPQGDTLDLVLHQRSGDMFLGVPFNMLYYALFLHLVATSTGFTSGKIWHTIGDAHIYQNHVEQVEKQLEREPLSAPTLKVSRINLNDAIYKEAEEVFKVSEYNHHPHIPAPVAV